jgi:hypothetical protein
MKTSCDYSSTSGKDNPGLFWILLFVFGVALYTLLVKQTYLPMIDIPQHAAQISMWKHFDAGTLVDSDKFELNWFTPYLGGYCMARFFAMFFSVSMAIRLTVLLSILLPLAAMYYGLRERQFVRWGVFLFIPFLFGWNFYWGFLNFLFAVGPCLFCIFVTCSKIDRSPDRVHFYLGAFSLILFFFHALLSLFYLGITGVYLLLKTADLRKCIPSLISVVPYFLLVVAWRRSIDARAPELTDEVAWRLGFERILELPTTMLSANYYGSTAALFVLLTSIILIVLGMVFFKTSKKRLSILLVVMLIYLTIPQFLFGTYHLYQRFSFLLIPFSLFVFTGVRDGRMAFARLFQIVSIIVPCVFLFFLHGTFRSFDQENKSFSQVLGQMESDKTVLSLMGDSTSVSVGGNPLLHFPIWYQSECGGRADFSFASFNPVLVRYKKSEKPLANDIFAWYPETFNWKTFEKYDYYIIRTTTPVTQFLVPEAVDEVHLKYSSDKWYLFEYVPAGDEAGNRL